MKTASSNLSFVFGLIFTIEAIIKITGLGTKYFYDYWNIFDFLVVIGSIIGFILIQFFSLPAITSTSVLRLIRVTRLFKVLKKLKCLRIVFETFIFTLPALINVGNLLLLLVLMFAVIGIEIFADVKINGSLNEN